MKRPSSYHNYSRRARAIAWGLDLVSTPARPLLRLASPRGPCPATPRSILVIRLDHLGDVLMTTPAIAALRAAYPGARLDALVAPWGRAAIEENPHVDRVLEAVAPWYEPRRGDLPAPEEVLRTSALLRREAYDWGFDFRGDPRVTLFYLLPAARRRFGFSRLGLEALLTDSLPYDRRRSMLDLALDLATAAGAPASSRRPVFRVDAEADREARVLLVSEACLEPRARFAVVAPGANRPEVQWGAEGFAFVCDALAEVGIQPVLVGRDQDAPVTRHVAALANRPLADLAGKTRLPTLAAILGRASLLLGNDSGAVHLAAAVDCPTVAIFGPTDPAVTFPYADGKRYLALAGPTDHPRPCFDAECSSDHGFSTLRPDVIFAACLLALRESAGRSEKLP